MLQCLLHYEFIFYMSQYTFVWEVIGVFLQLGKGNKTIKQFLSLWPENNLETNLLS